MYGQKGISRILIIVILLALAVALPATVKLVQKNQENRSKAAEEETCVLKGGVCLLYGSAKQAGSSCLIMDGNVKGITSIDSSCDADKVCCLPSP